LKEILDNLGSGLEVRVGILSSVLEDILAGHKSGGEGANVVAVWMTADEGVEEKAEEEGCKSICEAAGIEFKLWKDGKYFIDEYVYPSPHDFNSIMPHIP
jgi:deoxyribodipyrimidine photo-lyase